MHIILRRPKLGRTSCKEIAKHMVDTVARRCDWPKFRKQFLPNAINNGYLFRWGCTANIPEGYTVVNTSEAIHEVNSKTAFRKKLQEAKPEIVPKTWFDRVAFYTEDANNEEVEYFPLIVRPRKHAQGRMLFKCDDHDQLEDAVRRCGEGYYISEYIPKVREIRVFIVQGRAVWVAEKTPANPDAIAWNVHMGGRFDNVAFGDWPLRAVKCAIEGFNLSKLDFGGVDVMIDADGKPYILEINSAPSQTSPYRQECTAKAFQYILENGKDRIPLIDEKGGFRKFIHPAIHQEAIIVND